MPELVFEITAGGNIPERMRAKAAEVEHLIQDAIDDVLLFAEGEAKAKAGFKTGNLRRNITRTRARQVRPNYTEGSVGVSRQAPYGVYTHEGTGVFGTRHTPIVPLTGNVLVFRIGARTLFRPSVKGQRANPFIRDAFIGANASYAPGRFSRLGRELSSL